jgi:hypothetical protein
VGRHSAFILGLATGEMHVSSVQFGYTCDACELLVLHYSRVT